MRQNYTQFGNDLSVFGAQIEELLLSRLAGKAQGLKVLGPTHPTTMQTMPIRHGAQMAR